MIGEILFDHDLVQAIKVIMLAQEEARRLGHNFVGTEQILLGLIGEGTGIAAKVLKSMGVNLKEARVEVEKIIGRGSGFVAVEIPFTLPGQRGCLSCLWRRLVSLVSTRGSLQSRLGPAGSQLSTVLRRCYTCSPYTVVDVHCVE